VVLRADLDAYRRSEANRAAGASIVDARAKLVADMRTIDTRGCPREFQVAYLKHCHAWANWHAQLKADAEETDPVAILAVVTALSAGTLAPLLAAAPAVAQRTQVAAERIKPLHDAIRTTWQEVELIAVARGSKLPTLNQ